MRKGVLPAYNERHTVQIMGGRCRSGGGVGGFMVKKKKERTNLLPSRPKSQKPTA